MYRRLITIASLTTVVAAISATPAAANRTCGTVVIGGVQRERVTILRGQVSCAQARAAIISFGSGHGIEHGGRNAPFSRKTWTIPGGWSCGVGAGGGACIRGGSNYRNARDWVGYSFIQ
jgi:hypothetical protein